ncbi:MAG: hypothetical protein ACOYMS_10195 [Terrimicrobiaceae bacterium]
MKTSSLPRLIVLSLATLFALVATTFADTFGGTVSDLDAGNALLTVTSSVDQSTKVFKVTGDTVIIGPDGKPSQLMNLIETTVVTVEADPGPGNVATKITVQPDPAQQVP